MTEKRELEGIGYHHYDGIDDCLLVEQWFRRPDDLKGQSVPISKLLPLEVRCTDLSKGYQTKNITQKFKFRIIIETERSL
jgi:hypothetical protein